MDDGKTQELLLQLLQDIAVIKVGDNSIWVANCTYIASPVNENNDIITNGIINLLKWSLPFFFLPIMGPSVLLLEQESN